MTAAVSEVLRQFKEKAILDNVKETGDYLYKKLEEVMEKHDFIIGHRGMGLIQGLEFDKTKPAGDVCKKAISNGLIIITAGTNVIRFIPPLIISKSDVDRMIGILESSL